MGGELAVSMVLGDGVHVSGSASLDGISLEPFLSSNTPAIMDAVEIA